MTQLQNNELFPFLSKESFESEELYQKAWYEWWCTTSTRIIGHDVLEETSENGFAKILFKAGPLDGVKVSFGKVSFTPNDTGEITLSYDYETEGKPPRFLSKMEYEKILGDFLMTLIEDAMKKNDIAYQGGTDEGLNENRNSSTEESGSQ
jgi:hypothetical protein